MSNRKQTVLRLAFLGLLTALAGTPATAAVTDIASAPLITSSPQEVKPNLMFILDDSGSMMFTHMPDSVEDFSLTYGYASAQCNGIYYNPAITYTPPLTSTGTSYPNSSFTAAWQNGFDQTQGTVNLSTSFVLYTGYKIDPATGYPNSSNWSQAVDAAAVAAYYYAYSGTQTTEAARNYRDTTTTFYQECNSAIGSAPGSGVFTRKTVSSTSGPGNTDERTNFANWYSYYRNRMLMMKTATGRAFNAVGSDYRVGFMTLNNNDAPDFLNLDTFSGTQRTNWYSKLYGAIPRFGTPLREALSNAGRIYAGTLTSLFNTTVVDPVQFSCQRNYTLLSTDGYWNGNAGVKVDGSAIGQQDSTEPRPFADGGSTADTYQATLTVGTGTDTTVTSIKVNGAEILSGTASSRNSPRSESGANLATNISQRINACTAAIAGNCTVAGFTATPSGSTVTITAPSSMGPITYTPVVTRGTVSRTVTAGAFSGVAVTTGGTPDTLADVAMYYYKTDLRNLEDNVLADNDDPATWQHMTTFTLGLGARGNMVYSNTYQSDTTGDFYAVKSGTTASATVCTWQAAGTACNWPAPSADSPNNIDDLWHAAVNGRGRYFGARDPATLSAGLEDALTTIDTMRSASATSATSNPNVTAGDNFRFLSTFTSAEWTGELERYTIDLGTGDEAGGAVWQARALLDANNARRIYTYSGAAATRLRDFTWANLTAAEQAYFSMPWISSTSTGALPLTQFCSTGDFCLAGATQSAASGATLMAFIRGDRTNEGATSNIAKYYRQRVSLLGDTVDSRATYVKRPRYFYTDAGYAAFRTANATRAATVYIGANDGMLHAFDAETGNERWAYVPTMVIPNLFKLADKRYAVNHQYYVDGSPIDADVKFTSDSAWHTILVGGLNAGGRGYYALDITDPDNPKALWEFTAPTMGLSFGKPEVTKLKDGRWVVLLTSGYNNTTGSGDGRGYLYVVNAETGALINTIGTGVGTTTSPSGLAQIRAWVDNGAYNNTALRVYGGDLFGNVWRFDINGDIGAGGTDAQRLITLTGPTGTVQPITTKPELGRILTYPVVFVGTGRSLGVSDIYDANVQSIYAIKDRLDTSSYLGARVASESFVRQTFSNSSCLASQTYCTAGSPIRTASNNAVNFATNNGWYIDLPASRERADTDMQLAFGVLGISTNSLQPSACKVGGSNFVNFIDYKTGGALSTAAGMVSLVREDLSTGLSFSIVSSTDANGRTTRKLVGTQSTSRGTSDTFEVPPGGGTPSMNRTSWRELPTEQ